MVVVVIMILIIYVGYKILLPEISGYSIQEFEKDELGKFHLKQQRADKNRILKASVPSNNNLNQQHRTGMKIYREDVVDELKTKYRVDWNYKLTKSPWTVAANWFSSEGVFPESTPELGKIVFYVEFVSLLH